MHEPGTSTTCTRILYPAPPPFLNRGAYTGGVRLKKAFEEGYLAGLQKFALGPSTPADDFANNVEHGKDVPPPTAESIPPPGSLDDLLSRGNQSAATAATT